MMELTKTFTEFGTAGILKAGPMEKKLCIVEAVRTPFAKAASVLKDMPALELGRAVVAELLDRVDRPELTIDAVVFGNIIGPPEASNVARVIALKSGLPQTTPAYSLNMNCASGMLALSQACDLILSGKAKAVIAGGTESMSNAPLHFPKAMADFLTKLMRAKSVSAKLSLLAKLRPSYFKPVITLSLGLTDPVSGMIMGDTAEVLAKRYHITRQEQDEYALRSHQNYFKALHSGFYNDHLVPVFVPPKFHQQVEQDIGPRDNLTLQQLAKLRPYFDRRHGTVTVGNSCPITDGAAACLIMEEKEAARVGLTPQVFVRGYGYQGVAPEVMGLGPAVATPVAMKHAGVSIDDIELIEINEAFAAQIIANERLFASTQLYCKLTGETSSPLQEIDRDRLNVNGGAIALGHPVGTSGARIVINLYKEMCRQDLNIGLAAICVGGGLGGAMILERG